MFWSDLEFPGLSTQYLHNIYTTHYLHYLHTIYTLSTHYIHTIYTFATLSTHYLQYPASNIHNSYTLSAHGTVGGVFKMTTHVQLHDNFPTNIGMSLYLGLFMCLWMWQLPVRHGTVYTRKLKRSSQIFHNHRDDLYKGLLRLKVPISTFWLRKQPNKS